MADAPNDRKPGAPREPAQLPRRRVTLRIEVEADDMQTARGVVARIAARVATGGEAFEEQRVGNSAALSTSYDFHAPTGAAFAAALEEWRCENVGQEPPRGSGPGPIDRKRAAK